MTNRLPMTAAAIALSLVAAQAIAADPPAKEPGQTTEQQKPSAPPAPQPQKKAEPKPQKDGGSGAKQAGKEVAGTFKKFGKDVGDFFDGLFD